MRKLKQAKVKAAQVDFFSPALDWVGSCSPLMGWAICSPCQLQPLSCNSLYFGGSKEIFSSGREELVPPTLAQVL